MEGLGVGLAALAFWGFIAAIVVAGVWSEIRKVDAQHETMRRIVESGQEIDDAAIDRIFQRNKRSDRDLKTAGLIVIFTAPGLAAFGWFMGKFAEEAFIALLGIAALVGFIGVGLLVAANFAKRSFERDDDPTRKRSMVG